MTKTLTTQELRKIGTLFHQAWAEHKDRVRLKGRSNYNLVALKRTLEQELEKIEEALVMMLVNTHGGTITQEGSITIPPDNAAAADKDLTDLGNSEVTINYSAIVLEEHDHLPLPLMEALFEFVEFKED